MISSVDDLFKFVLVPHALDGYENENDDENFGDDEEDCKLGLFTSYNSLLLFNVLFKRVLVLVFNLKFTALMFTAVVSKIVLCFMVLFTVSCSLLLLKQ